MKINKGLILIVLGVLLLAVAAQKQMARSPLTVFLLRGADDNVEAFRLNLFLDHRDPEVTALSLTPALRKEGSDILKQRNARSLADYSQNFGKAQIVIGSSSPEEAWPAVLGGGLHVLGGDPADAFDNLSWPDRLYLALTVKVPPPAPFLAPETPSAKPATNAAAPTPLPASTPLARAPVGALRVKILNGCGIKGAADWAARRLKGDGIEITETGNADHFHYPKTILRTSAGVPVSLEEAAERLGLTRESIEETPASLPDTDVVVVVGKDFRQLKERVRERRHNGTQ